MDAGPRNEDDGADTTSGLHCVYVTRTTEYHFEGDTCVAVRDRRTGEFLASHLAAGRRLGALDCSPASGSTSTSSPRVGDALYLPSPERSLVTSPIERIEKPSLAVVARYPARRVA
jgi:hypothetical protein